MTIEYIRQTVSAYFTANFAGCEIQHDNHTTIDPSTRTLPWAKISFRFTTNDQITVGEPPKFRRRGAVQIDIYVKQGKGTQPSFTIADTVESLFSRLSLSGIEFSTPTPLTPQEAAGWTRLTIRCPFYYDY